MITDVNKWSLKNTLLYNIIFCLISQDWLIFYKRSSDSSSSCYSNKGFIVLIHYSYYQLYIVLYIYSTGSFSWLFLVDVSCNLSLNGFKKFFINFKKQTQKEYLYFSILSTHITHIITLSGSQQLWRSLSSAHLAHVLYPIKACFLLHVNLFVIMTHRCS